MTVPYVDPRQTRRAGVVRSLGLGVLVLFLVAASLGLVGPDGPLSEASARRDGLAVRYERTLRYFLPHELHIEIASGHTGDGVVEVWIDRAYVDGFDTTSIDPEPEGVAVEGDRLVYTFKGGMFGGEMTARFGLRPTGRGVREARVGIVGGPAVSFQQLVYP